MSRAALLKDPGLTFAEKAIGIKAQHPHRVTAGEVAIVTPDLMMAQDSTGPLSIKILQDMGIHKVHDAKKILLMIDHTYPAADIKVANLHAMQRAFAFQHGCALVEGSISHQHILEEYARPGMLIIGADSHTCQAGCVGAYATGVGSTDMSAAWASGTTWLRVPETYRIHVNGRLSKGVFSRDIIIDFIGAVGEDGANYKSLEWRGSTIRNMSMDSRACIANASMECGCKNAVMPPDAVTRNFMRRVHRTPQYSIQPGKNASYSEEFDIDAKDLDPVVAAPHRADNVKAVREVEGTPIDQAFIGSTTNARMEDLRTTARILKGRSVKARCVVTPASRRIYEQAIQEGLVSTFMKAGAVFTNSTCGACVGTHLGILGYKEVCISSSSRNFQGRMGDNTSAVYLASPATVAASAIEGKIASPEGYL